MYASLEPELGHIAAVEGIQELDEPLVLCSPQRLQNLERKDEYLKVPSLYRPVHYLEYNFQQISRKVCDDTGTAGCMAMTRIQYGTDPDPGFAMSRILIRIQAAFKYTGLDPGKLIMSEKHLFVSIRRCSGCETQVIVINPRAYMYINPRTVSVENAPIAFMKYISLS